MYIYGDFCVQLRSLCHIAYRCRLVSRSISAAILSEMTYGNPTVECCNTRPDSRLVLLLMRVHTSSWRTYHGNQYQERYKTLVSLSQDPNAPRKEELDDTGNYRMSIDKHPCINCVLNLLMPASGGVAARVQGVMRRTEGSPHPDAKTYLSPRGVNETYHDDQDSEIPSIMTCKTCLKDVDEEDKVDCEK